MSSDGKRVLAVASGGGHWKQLRLLEASFECCRVTWVTTKRDLSGEPGIQRAHCVRDATRWNKLGLVWLAVRMITIVLRERPEVVISTGAAPGLFAIVFGKILGARTVWIDSVANVNELSGCGAQIGQFADLWLTQWPELARPEGPQYAGTIL